MTKSIELDRRALINATLATASASALGLMFPSVAQAKIDVRTSNRAATAGVTKVMLGGVALACVTDRRRVISVGGGFRSRTSASQLVVRTALEGLSNADFQEAADLMYASVISAFGARGIEVVDNAALLAMLASSGKVQPNFEEFSFPEGNGQNSKSILVGASPFGGFVPLPNWTPMGGGFSGLASMGRVQAALGIEQLFRQQAASNNVAIVGIMIGINPAKIESSFGSDWRVPDAFGNGGLVRTGTLSTQTGLSSQAWMTRLAVYPANGRAAGEVTMRDEIGIQGGIGTLADTTSNATRGVQAAAAALSLLGGGGRANKTTNYTLTADKPSYLAGVSALSTDVTQALIGGMG